VCGLGLGFGLWVGGGVGVGLFGLMLGLRFRLNTPQQRSSYLQLCRINSTLPGLLSHHNNQLQQPTTTTHNNAPQHPPQGAPITLDGLKVLLSRETAQDPPQVGGGGGGLLEWELLVRRGWRGFLELVLPVGSTLKHPNPNPTPITPNPTPNPNPPTRRG